MTVHGSGETIEAVLGQLRAEEPLEEDLSRQAVLRHEIAVLEESQGDLKAAASEYLAAFHTAPDFREPLEALIRMGAKHGEPDPNKLEKLLQALADSAGDPEEASRALWQLASHRADALGDHAGAKSCLEQALEGDPRDAALWLALELSAARLGDAATRAKAIQARAQMAVHPTVQGKLLVELAELLALADDGDEAAKILDEAVALEGRARFASRVALERLARTARNQELMAVALEGQAELIALASCGTPAPEASEDAAAAEAAAEANGVPRALCTPAHAACRWLRASELRRRAGDPWGAVAALTEASQRLPDDALLSRLRIAASDAAGDGETSLALARAELERGASGAIGAALWVRLALAAEEDGANDQALEAFDRALALEPSNAIAETLRLEHLVRAGNAEQLARAMEAAAAGNGDRPRASDGGALTRWLVAAFVWGVQARQPEHACRALARCIELGADPERCDRIERTLASLCHDEDWYDRATARVVAREPEGERRASLWLDLARRRLERDDFSGATAALAELSRAAGGDDGENGASWLARVLSAYAIRGDGHARSAAVSRYSELEPDQAQRRGLVIMAAWLALREGSDELSLSLLRREHEQTPADLTVALLLAEALRVSDAAAAAAVLQRTATAVDDPSLAGCLSLEAGLRLWRAGKRREAIDAFEVALEPTPIAARKVLSWALRAVDPDDVRTRRRVAEIEEESESYRALGALERFGLGVLDRDGDSDAWAALEQLDQLDTGGDVALATALARLLWASDAIEPASMDAALDRIERFKLAAVLARGERFRRARFVERDAAAALAAAKRWAEIEPAPHTALEWLAAAFAGDDRAEELHARRAMARQLDGSARTAVLCSAALVAVIQGHGDAINLFDVDTAGSERARLVNFEVALPGCAPARRANALRGLRGAVDDETAAQAERLAVWSDLARGAYEEAQRSFRQLCDRDPKDVASWEGLRAASEALGDHKTLGVALARLGHLTRNDLRAAELWERAGLTLLEHTEAHDDAEIALERALGRDPKRKVAFDKLFRRVRARNEDDRLLRMIAKRIDVTDDTEELTKMYWERARVLRKKGEIDAALKSLADVTMLRADHVAALALLGEIRINRGEFAEAAPVLARLASLKDAPEQQRRISGVAAMDLYEKKLDQPDKALEVLAELHKNGLSTLVMRERLAKLAASVGRWEQVVAILEELMLERDGSPGRAEAARLAMAVYRDKLREPKRAVRAVSRLLHEIPDDPEALELTLRAPLDELKEPALATGKEVLDQRLQREPMDPGRVRILADIGAARGRLDAQRAALGVLAALVELDDPLRQLSLRLDARMIHLPAHTLDPHALGAICDAQDIGALAELFAAINEVVANALLPSLKSEGVTKKERVEAGDPLRVEVARWMGALGFDDFDLFLGVRRREGAVGIAADKPTLVVGSELRAPLDAKGRAAIAREAFALRRGITAVLHCDDHTIASIVASVSNEVRVAVPEPAFAIYKEVDRAMRKAMTRKARKEAEGLCRRVLESREDVNVWVEAARRSTDRMALIASGDAGVVIDAMVGVRGTPARAAWEGDPRSKSLLAFALSDDYLELRARLGMGMK